MTVPARTVFLGSGSFALPIVARLAGHPAIQLQAVVSAPPRPAGRGGAVRPSPVAGWAYARDLPTLAPKRLRSPEAIEDVRRHSPELLVLADYGQIVPAELLHLPRHGALNLHPSLLPRHRGASPIAAAILAGDEQTGVTLIQMDAGLDTGPIIAQRPVAIGSKETAADLEARLAELAADLLADSLPAWLAAELVARPQPERGVTLTRPLRRSDGLLDPAKSVLELERQVRAYQPWPGSHLETHMGRLIVWRARAVPGGSRADERTELNEPRGPAAAHAKQGELVAMPGSGEGRSLGLATSDGLLELVEVQPAGGRRMAGAELLRGRPGLIGTAS